MNQVSRSKSLSSTQVITRVAVLSAIAFILMFFQFPLAVIAPPFIQLDVSDVPGLIAGFAMGPLAGIAVEFFKNILHMLLQGTSTMGVGELSNFIIGSTLVGVSSVIYRRKRTYKTAIIALFAGTVCMASLAVLSNYFVVFPLYAKAMGLENIVAAGTAINGNITSLWTMMIYSILPFNLIKGLVVTIVTLLIYKKVSYLLH